MPTQPSEKPRKSPKQARARATVDAILMAAAHLLRTGGRERTTTNEIAKKAGVSIGSLYQYFPNKEAIWQGLRERHDAFFENAARERIEDTGSRGFRSAVRFMIDQMVMLHALDGPLHGALYADDGFADREERLVEYRGYLERFFVENATRLRPIPDPELAAFVMVHALVALVHGVAISDPERLRHPDYAAELTELLVRYCGAPEDD